MQPAPGIGLAPIDETEIAPVAIGRDGAECFDLKARRLDRDAGLQDQDEMIGRLFQIRPVEREDPALSPVMTECEKLAQPAPTGAVDRIGEQHAAIRQGKACSRYQPDSDFFRCPMRPDHTRYTMPVGKPDRREAEMRRLGNQFLGQACALQEGESRERPQLDDRGLGHDRSLSSIRRCG